MSDPVSPAEIGQVKPRPVLMSRVAAVLGGLSFAAAVTAITLLKSRGTAVPTASALLIFAVFGGMAAVLLGMLGIAQARRQLAPGILLGLLGVLTGGVTAFVAPLAMWSVRQYEAMQMAEPAVKATNQWIMFVGSGNIAAAQALSRPPIDETKLTDAFEQMQTWGAIQSVDPRYGGDARDPASIEIQAKVVLDRGDKIVITKWDATGAAPALTHFEFRDDPKSAPTTDQSKS